MVSVQAIVSSIELAPQRNHNQLKSPNFFFSQPLTALTLAGASQAATTVIPGLYNTGTGADYLSVTGNPVDLHWTLAGGAANVGGTNGSFPLGPWLLDDTISRWVTPDSNAAASFDANGDGFYNYNLSFNLTAAQSAGASLAGRYAADNLVSLIKLNNVSIIPVVLPGGSQFQSWTDFSFANAAAFQTGQNDLTFTVRNYAQNGGNPSGLRVEFQGATIGAIPEPGTWALMIMGFGGAGAMLRANRRRSVAA